VRVVEAARLLEDGAFFDTVKGGVLD